jgi:hypothetical protein
MHIWRNGDFFKNVIFAILRAFSRSNFTRLWKHSDTRKRRFHPHDQTISYPFKACLPSTFIATGCIKFAFG